MTDYSELVKALRHCTDNEPSNGDCWNCPYQGEKCHTLLSDAADAIEALIADVEKKESRITGLGNRIFALEQQLPKRGEWIWDDKRCIYVCSVCGSPKVRENMDRHIIKEQAYCYHCGAKMMEGQG